MPNNFESNTLNREHDTSSHKIDIHTASRITDELVERVAEDGSKIVGEVIGAFGSGYESEFENESDLLNHFGTMCVVRYADNSVGIASRAYVGDKPVLHPGRLLEVDSAIYFGRSGDADTDEPFVMNRTEVLGRKALTGLVSTFEPTVSRIQGSIDFWSDGTVCINDGYEYADPQTRHVIDKASGNSTRVYTGIKDTKDTQADIVSPLHQQQESEKREQRFMAVFGVPEAKPRDRFGNIQDRVSLITDKSKQEAGQTLSAIKDSELKNIIETHTAGLSPVESVEKILSNKETRIAIGKYLMEKVVRDADIMPDRIKGHRGKAGNHPGYPEGMTSKEYAALLALSMLDGTFVSERSLSDPVEFVSRGNSTDINGGQHRLAALQLLDLDYDTAPTVIEQVRRYY